MSTGVSPRGVQRFFEAVRTRAVVEGRLYATPDDVTAMAPSMLSHRLVSTADTRIGGVEPRSVVDDLVSETRVPQLEA